MPLIHAEKYDMLKAENVHKECYAKVYPDRILADQRYFLKVYLKLRFNGTILPRRRVG